MEWIKKNAKALAIGLGAVTVVGAGVFFFIKKRQDSEFEEEEAILSEDTKGQLSKLQKANIIAGITIKKNEKHADLLDIETLKQIHHATTKFAQADFIELTQNDRKERRSKKKDIADYVEAWNQFTIKLEEIVNKAQTEVIKELEISEKVFDDSHNHYFNENNSDLFLMNATLPQNLKSGLTSEKNLSLEEFKNVLRAQIKGLEEEGKNLEEYKKVSKSSEESAAILQNKVHDMIFEEFAVEEEDVLGAISRYLEDDTEVQQLIQTVQNVSMQLMPLPDDILGEEQTA